MGDEYKQGDEFKTGLLSEAARRFQLEAARQGRNSFAAPAGHIDQAALSGRRAPFDTFTFIMSQQEQTARLLQTISEAEIAAAEAHKAAQKREREAQEYLDQIRRAATQTKDGRTVYRTADGTKAFDDNGNELTPEEIKGIDWKPGAATWEERRQAEDRREDARRATQEIEEYQDRLRKGRERIQSGNPLSDDELKEIEAAVDNMPDSVRHHLPRSRSTSAAKEYQQDAANAQSLRDPFSSAVAAHSAETISPTKIISRPLDISPR